jgi:hypothetical protein
LSHPRQDTCLRTSGLFRPTFKLVSSILIEN